MSAEKRNSSQGEKGPSALPSLSLSDSSSANSPLSSPPDSLKSEAAATSDNSGSENDTEDDGDDDSGNYDSGSSSEIPYLPKAKGNTRKTTSAPATKMPPKARLSKEAAARAERLSIFRDDHNAIINRFRDALSFALHAADDSLAVPIGLANSEIIGNLNKYRWFRDSDQNEDRGVLNPTELDLMQEKLDCMIAMQQVLVDEVRILRRRSEQMLAGQQANVDEFKEEIKAVAAGFTTAAALKRHQQNLEEDATAEGYASRADMIRQKKAEAKRIHADKLEQERHRLAEARRKRRAGLIDDDDEELIPRPQKSPVLDFSEDIIPARLSDGRRPPPPNPNAPPYTFLAQDAIEAVNWRTDHPKPRAKANSPANLLAHSPTTTTTTTDQQSKSTTTASSPSVPEVSSGATSEYYDDDYQAGQSSDGGDSTYEP